MAITVLIGCTAHDPSSSKYAELRRCQFLNNSEPRRIPLSSTAGPQTRKIHLVILQLTCRDGRDDTTSGLNRIGIHLHILILC